jgi:hypothetical protein
MKQLKPDSVMYERMVIMLEVYRQVSKLNEDILQMDNEDIQIDVECPMLSNQYLSVKEYANQISETYLKSSAEQHQKVLTYVEQVSLNFHDQLTKVNADDKCHVGAYGRCQKMQQVKKDMGQVIYNTKI